MSSIILLVFSCWKEQGDLPFLLLLCSFSPQLLWFVFTMTMSKEEPVLIMSVSLSWSHLEHQERHLNDNVSHWILKGSSTDFRKLVLSDSCIIWISLSYSVQERVYKDFSRGKNVVLIIVWTKNIPYEDTENISFMKSSALIKIKLQRQPVSWTNLKILDYLIIFYMW